MTFNCDSLLLQLQMHSFSNAVWSTFQNVYKKESLVISRHQFTNPYQPNNMKIISILFLTALACAAAVAIPDHHHHDDDHHHHEHHHDDHHEYHHHHSAKPYHFKYGVHDDHYGPEFSQEEHSDGKVVMGEYKVHLPDRRIQVRFE